MLNNKLILRVILKLFSGALVLWVFYVFTAGLFSGPHQSKTKQQIYSLLNLEDNQSIYFDFNQRKLLVIKSSDKYKVFWADDPVYGCKLEFFIDFIKPVCIDIKYNLEGYSQKKDQQLSAPTFKINSKKELIVYE